MPQKVIKFTGINRKVNEYQSSGACEELINIRPNVNGNCSVVKDKYVYGDSISYEYVYKHSFGNIDNIILVNDGNVLYKPNSGKPVGITSEFAGKNGVEISSAGNVLVIYNKEEDKQVVFKFEDEKYVSYNINPRQITNVEIAYAVGTVGYTSVAEASDAGSFNAALQKAASAFQQKFPNGLCGYAIVGCSYELEDGQELWSTAFVVANGEITQGYQEPRLNENDKTVLVSGSGKTYLCLSFADMPYSGVRKINVYASRPVFPYFVENTLTTSFKISKQPLDEIDFSGQVMYYQGSINPNETSARLLLNFNTEQAGEGIMKVMSGCISRTGQMVSYNNRFHFYNSTVSHIIQLPSVSRDSLQFRIGVASGPEIFEDNIRNNENEIAPYWIAYVEINGEWKLINKVYRFFEKDTNDFIYPMGNVKQMAFVKASMSDDSLHVPYEEMFYVNLKNSTAYNYSCAFNVTPSIVSATSFYNKMRSIGQVWGNGFDTSVVLKTEGNAVNVSSQFNPFVFPVEYSYSVGGEIMDITTAYTAISSTQAGQYPLTVFTSNGIFALEQGNGEVLYSNVVPLQPHVIQGKTTPTPYGTFFVSSKNLYLLNGRDAINVSYPLNGKLEAGIRDNSAYKALNNTHYGLHDFKDTLSKVEFEEFVSDSVMLYDQLQNELYISNTDPNIKYSYVFNLDTKTYFKIDKSYARAQNGARYAIENSSGTGKIVDLSTEIEGKQHIFLQSRPFALEAFATHIQRLKLLVDAKLEEGHNLCFSVFGSDNLYDWKCIISSQKHDTVLRHIRTNRAAKSYRDYIIVINGVVSTDTDISDIIADYTIVGRKFE